MDSSKQEAIDILLLNGYVGEIGLQTRALLSTSDLLGTVVSSNCSYINYFSIISTITSSSSVN